MINAFEKILEMLEEEREYSYADFTEYVNEYSPCLDSEYDDFFHRGLERASRLVKEVAEEYKNGHFGCNFNGEHEKCKDCCLTDCKDRNTIWFGLDVTDTNVGNKWIPCSNIDRLPNIEDFPQQKYRVLASCTDGIVRNTTIKSLLENKIHYSCSHEPFSYKAWQPLPEPYKEKE